MHRVQNGLLQAGRRGRLPRRREVPRLRACRLDRRRTRRAHAPGARGALVRAQVLPLPGIPWTVEGTPQEKSHLSLLESVRCLECSEVYSKPLAGGTVEENPGCPTCGYVGWISVSLPGGHS